MGGWPTRGRRERYIYKTQYCSRTLCTHPPNAAVYYAKTGSLDRRGCIYTVLICRYLGMEDVTRALYMYVCMYVEYVVSLANTSMVRYALHMCRVNGTFIQHSNPMHNLIQRVNLTHFHIPIGLWFIVITTYW